MLRIGSVILTVGVGLQFIVSVLSLIASLVSTHAPLMKMVLSEDEIASLDTKVLAATKSLAILHNSGATICTCLTLVLIWTSMINGHRWAFWVILATGIFGHVMWFLSDRLLGGVTSIVNFVFSAVFIIGIILSAIGIFKQ